MSNLTKKKQEILQKAYREQIESKELIQLKIDQKADFRLIWYNKQKKKCPIINQKISFDSSSIDHKHKLKSDKLGGKDCLGLIRGVLYSPANVWEGKVVNSFKRMGLSKFIDIPQALRNLADYLENPPIPPLYIYPGEEPKEKRKKLGKRIYNKVVKYYFNMYPKRKKLPKRNVYLTKEWVKYKADVEFYLKKKQKKKTTRTKKVKKYKRRRK